MTQPTELPKHWQTKRLADVCRDILGGGTPTTSRPEYWDGNIPWISSADVYGLKDIRPRRTITKKGLKESATNLLPKGGIIVVTRVGLGKIAIAPYDLSFSQDSQGLILDENVILKSYALLCLSRAVQIFKRESRGTTISGVTKKQLNDVIVSLPPIDEQERIVAKIEELFSELNAGVESLKKAQAQLKTYRQAVLKSAFEGRLTNKTVSNEELPCGWKWVRLGDHAFVTKLAGFEFTKFVKYRENGDIPVIRAQNVAKDRFIPRNFTFVDREVMEKLPRSRVFGGEVLMVFVGAGLGNVGILPKGAEYFLGPNVAKIALNQEFNNKYIVHFLSSAIGFGNVTGSSKATAQGSISMANIRDLVVPLCSIDEQEKVLEEIESRLSVCDKLEETIAASLKQSEALRQSILKQAFEGKLVAQESAVVYQPKNINFYRMQVLAIMLICFRRRGFHFAEMTSAKNAFLLDRIFGIPIYDNYKRWHLGPYSSEIKKTINTKQYFRIGEYNKIEVLNEEKLLKYSNPYSKKIADAVNELAEIYQSFDDPKVQSYKIELLATVCKVVDDINTTEIKAVRESMAEWPINLPGNRFKNKAEKFSEEDTVKCVAFIKEKDWVKKLITI